MGEFIIKTAPDRDLYLIWSTIVDSPIWVGDRAELLGHLWAEYRREHPHSTPEPGFGPDARVARADTCGSSARDIGIGRWDHESLMVGEASPRDGLWWRIRRDRLAAYAETLLADDEAAGWALMEPDEVQP